MVLIDVAKEAIEACVGHSDTRLLEGLRELRFVQVAVVVAVDGLEERP
jgi:hypothetical protein